MFVLIYITHSLLPSIIAAQLVEQLLCNPEIVGLIPSEVKRIFLYFLLSPIFLMFIRAHVQKKGMDLFSALKIAIDLIL